MSSLRRLISLRPALLLAFIAVALLARAAIPAGWMPSLSGGAIAISICSGEGRATMWLDKDGQVHKSDPSKADHPDHPCAFAATAALAHDPVPGTPAMPMGAADQAALTGAPATIGQGLAAPPPPQTGPPLLI